MKKREEKIINLCVLCVLGALCETFVFFVVKKKSRTIGPGSTTLKKSYSLLLKFGIEFIEVKVFEDSSNLGFHRTHIFNIILIQRT